MNVTISGAGGLLGSALVTSLRAAGHRVRRLVRRPVGASADAVFWDPAAGVLDPDCLAGTDAVVHLAGENVAGGRWTRRRKRRIRDSRVMGTRLIAAGVAAAVAPPDLICASAIGYYGDRGDQLLTEDSSSGEGFLAEVCRLWEAAVSSARAAGSRVTNLRIGVVLSRHGGALARMRLPFRLGLGGVVGDGRQQMSWIHIDDLVRSIEHVLRHRDLAGPVNVVSPNPASNRELTRTLGRVLRRPTFLPLPAVAVRAVLGSMGEELLLASTRVAPARLLGSGFRFRFPHLEGALRHLLDAAPITRRSDSA